MARAAEQTDIVGTIRTQLQELSRDLWWTWNPEGRIPFEMLDPVLWRATKQSPMQVLDAVTDQRIALCAKDDRFLDALAKANKSLEAYHDAATWWGRGAKGDLKSLRVAYFCSEYAVHESMQQYAGGLGVLAGDHLKSASDLGISLCAVGLLYRQGYYLQELDEDGSTRVYYPEYDFERMPVEDTGEIIVCPIGSSRVKAKVWSMEVGRTTVYLLDSDVKGNSDEDRELTRGLYRGEPSLRLRQQVLLGVGGCIALQHLDEPVTVYHLNEGHAAFVAYQRIAQLVKDGMKPADAKAHVKATTVFTTHTPVPAGHDRYGVEEAYEALRPVLRQARIEEDEFAALGRERPDDFREPICMTAICLRFASRINGVSQLHGEVSRDMWTHIYGCSSKDVPIGSITNGVHARTWIDPDAEAFWRKEINLRLDRHTPTMNGWEKALGVDRPRFWALRSRLRARLVHFIRERLARQALRRGEGSAGVNAAMQAFSPDALTIGFARRFATYKRAPLIFQDLERLKSILNDPRRPVQLVFAGKAHPRDVPGQEYAQRIHELCKQDGLRGKVALVEEYDMEVGRMLTAGSDVWLNNPLRPYEASGTSGMKPPMHGGINCSILDGWWPESFDGRNGWAIGDTQPMQDREAQDRKDSQSLYAIIEGDMRREFYDRDAAGLPQRWIDRALQSAATVPAMFNTHRMLAEYLREAYIPAHRGGL